MSNKIDKSVKTVAFLFYFLIVFEIIYMITPFLAFYYYPKYGLYLNFLNGSPLTSWMTGFFLPHYSESSSFFFDPRTISSTAWFFVSAGFVIFLIGAFQIYYSKFTRRGAVKGGLYKYVRNPQYTAFAVMGFGVLLIWPRFLILIMFVTMLFVYYFLAKKEEQECTKKFGNDFIKYKNETPMFLPWKFSKFYWIPESLRSGPKRVMFNFSLYILALLISVTLAVLLRNYSLSTISTYATENSVTVSTAKMNKNKIEKILKAAESVPEVKKRLLDSGYYNGEKFLNYILPLEWILADIPLEPIPEGTHGHIQPENYNRDEFKVLFTVAGFSSGSEYAGMDILKKAVERKPVIVAKINVESGEVIGIDTPPAHVAWGDIPTPLF